MRQTTVKTALIATLIAATMTLAGCQAAPDVTGSWGDASASSAPSLELSSNGDLTGTDGCNRLTGSYTADGTELTFTGVASTLMFCEGVDTWLSRLSKAKVSGNMMTVFDISGKEIGSLER